MTLDRQPPLRFLLLAAPVIFVAHFLEEGPAFVTWFNAHVARGITQPLFWAVNSAALCVTVAIVVLEWLSRSRVSATIVIAWISFLMFANAMLHLAGAIVDRAYMPGLVTALLLYLPFSALVVMNTLRMCRLPRSVIATAAVIGALPMLAHGYLIIFRGSRLF